MEDRKMYDELERAAGARSGGGLSLLGWIGIALTVFTLLGAAGAFYAYRFVRQQVDDVVERFEAMAPLEASPLVARTVARTLAELDGMPAMDGDDLARAVSRALAAPAVRQRWTVQRGAEEAPPTPAEAPRDSEAPPAPEPPAPPTARADAPSSDGESVEGFFRIRTSEGDFTADLRADDRRGALVVRGPDGAVVVDLSADAGGGRLVLRGEGEVARIDAGSGAQGPPRWVPGVQGERRDVRHVISGRAGDAAFGAVTWETDASPEAVVERYRERLGDRGWELRAEHRLGGADESSASVMGHDPESGRIVLFTAGTEGGVTRVVQGWAEGRANR